MLVQKVKFCNDVFGFSVNFNASSGGLHHFIAWHYICESSVQGKKLNIDSAVATEFRKKIQAFVSENQLTYEQMHNTHESGLSHHHPLPKSTEAEMKKAFLDTK